jgi:hypothetical protein
MPTAIVSAIGMLSVAARAAASATEVAGSPFPAGYNGRARTPPMGWRSWNAFHQHIAQDVLVGDVMEALVAINRTVAGHAGPVSLQELGYTSFNLKFTGLTHNLGQL